ncbi:MAG: glycosyltransferase [Gammaproteobacteria bacterium]
MKQAAPLRITHVVFSFDYGGLERRILRLVDGLGPLGAEFRIVSLRHSDGRFLERHPQVDHVVLNATPGIDWAAIRRLAALLRENGTHIVHSHNWVSMLEGIVAGRLARVPVVVHGEHGASRFEPAQLQWKRTLVQAALARAADSIIPVNESIRDRIADVWKLPPARCTVIRNGVDTARFLPGPEALREPIVIGSISRLERIKNFPCLVRAVHRLNRDAGRVRYRLVIVGEGQERAGLEQLVAELGAGAYIEMPGATDEPEQWYPRFDLYVNCSFSEGMSNTVLEAMACGLPVVATAVAGHQDWLAADGNALFFASDDDADLARCLATLADDDTARNAMRSRNRRRVEAEFSQNRFIERYVEHYRALLQRRGLRWN